MPDTETEERNSYAFRTQTRKVSAFGLECKLLCEEHLPLVLQWRNHPEVLPFMDDTRLVTPDILQFWFRRMSSNDTALYHIAYKDDKPVGFTGINNIDWKSSTFECEIFLNPEYFGQKLSFNIFLCRELILDKLCLETDYSKIRTENTKSISLFTKLGYEYIGSDGDFNFYKSEYIKRRKALGNIAREQGMEEEFILYFGQE